MNRELDKADGGELAELRRRVAQLEAQAVHDRRTIAYLRDRADEDESEIDNLRGELARSQAKQDHGAKVVA